MAGSGGSACRGARAADGPTAVIDRCRLLQSGDQRISSAGVLFTSEHMLLPGRRVELAISWPAQLNNKCALKLVARGRVVRFEQGRAAIEIQQYEFRTLSSASAPVGPRQAVNFFNVGATLYW